MLILVLYGVIGMFTAIVSSMLMSQDFINGECLFYLVILCYTLGLIWPISWFILIIMFITNYSSEYSPT